VNTRKQVLFIGADLQRKGGDIIYDLARLESFRKRRFPRRLAARRSRTGKSSRASIIPAGIRRSHSAGGGLRRFHPATRADCVPAIGNGGGRLRSPAIITGRGGISEIVVEGSTGSVLPRARLDLFARELSNYLREPQLMAQRGRNARRHIVRNYSKRVTLRSCMT